MIKIFLPAIAALALWLASFPALAYTPTSTADETCQQALENRSSLGRVIHLYGDSISRGDALGTFPDLLDPAHPLYAFRSIPSTANWALMHNNRPERFAYCGNINPTSIANRIASGVIRSGDMIVLEDAGDVSSTLGAYYTAMWNARVAASTAGVTIVMMTMFEYCHDGNLACGADLQWDLPRYSGPSNAGTLNDVLRRVGTVTTNPLTGQGLPGSTVLIDMNWVMDSWRNSALSIDGVDVILPDGVHPNVWGQMKMVQHLFAAAGLRQYIVNVDPMQDLAEAHYTDLAYGSATFTGARARVYVAANLGAN